MTIRGMFCCALIFVSMVGVRERPLSAQAAPGSGPYLIKDLGTLGGADSQAFALNESGGTAGVAQRADGSSHAFFFNGTLKDLGTLGGASSVAAGMTRSGQVVGRALTSVGNSRAFLYSNGSMRSLGTLGGSQSAAYAINDAGEIVGSASTSGDAATRAFLYRNGTMTRLGATFGGTNSVATAINDQGDVAGYASTAGNASTRAFLFTGGVQINLGTLGGMSEATGVNTLVEVVGRSVVPSGAQHAFLYSGGTMQDLGTLGGRNSEALAISPLGRVVVGSSDIAVGSGRHAFLYVDGRMTDLNTILPPGSGWVLEAATAINSVAEITGYGRIGRHRHAFRLTPETGIGLFEGGARSQEDSNLPHNGVQVGRNVTFVTSIVAEVGPVRNVVFTDTMSGPIEIQGIRTYQEIASCQAVQKTVTCRIPALGPTTIDADEVWVTVRVTGPGRFSHTAGVTADNARGGTISEENIGIALKSFTLSASTTAGGKAVQARADLTSTAPPGGAVVRIVSSNPTVAPVPAQLVVEVPTNTRNFNIVPAVVTQPTSVTIMASYGQVTISRTLTVLPPAVATLSLTRSTIVGGCQTATGRVTLTGSAPAAGAAVKIAATSTGVVAPSSVTVPKGAMSASFTVSGRVVHAFSKGTFTASYGGGSKTLDLSVRPIYLTAVSLTPTTVKGGSGVSGTATIECGAPAAGITGTLSSTNPAAAAPMSSTLTFVPGATTRGFSVRTTKVTASTLVTIKASLNGVTKNALLTVKP